MVERSCEAGLLLTTWLGARVRPQWVGGLGAVYIRGLLIHGVDVVRQSRRDLLIARAATNTFSGRYCAAGRRVNCDRVRALALPSTEAYEC